MVTKCKYCGVNISFILVRRYLDKLSRHNTKKQKFIPINLDNSIHRCYESHGAKNTDEIKQFGNLIRD